MRLRKNSSTVFEVVQFQSVPDSGTLKRHCLPVPESKKERWSHPIRLQRIETLSTAKFLSTFRVLSTAGLY
jgi:hypothetical protein